MLTATLARLARALLLLHTLLVAADPEPTRTAALDDSTLRRTLASSFPDWLSEMVAPLSPSHDHAYHTTAAHNNAGATVNITATDKKKLEAVMNVGCKYINDVPTAAEIEAKKAARNLLFAVIYSGQVCHGRGADVLWHPANMAKLWSNQVEMLHRPLGAWGTVHVFGIFEEAVPREGADAKEARKASGCNDFAGLANWTRLDFMPSEAAVCRKCARLVSHGEERRAEGLYRFIGVERWERYDFIIHTRPDVVLRSPVTSWGLDLARVNTPHFESNGPRECDPAKLLAGSGTNGRPYAMGDAFVMYPRRWTPFFLYGGSSVMGRGALQRFWMQDGCSKTDMKRDVKVLDMSSCHNTRSCLWHPLYYLYGERLCGEPLRPGETDGEFCVGGSTGELGGLKGCALINKRASPEEAEAAAPWMKAHYQPYNGSMLLAPCMAKSVTGFNCPVKGENEFPPVPVPASTVAGAASTTSSTTAMAAGPSATSVGVPTTIGEKPIGAVKSVVKSAETLATEAQKAADRAMDRAKLAQKIADEARQEAVKASQKAEALTAAATGLPSSHTAASGAQVAPGATLALEAWH